MFTDKPGFEFMEHTADAKFRAYGSSLAEAFTNAALASFNVIVDTDSVKPAMKRSISVKAKRPTALLYDFLEDLLFLLDTEGFLLSKVETLKIYEGHEMVLDAVVYGDHYKGYEVHGNIKSVTYNDMEIKKTDEGYELVVVLDL